METDHGMDQKMGTRVVGCALHLLYANVLRPYDMAFCAGRSLAFVGRPLLNVHGKIQC